MRASAAILVPPPQDVISRSTQDELKRRLEKHRGRPVTDTELGQLVDQLYALADLILETWTEQPESS